MTERSVKVTLVANVAQYEREMNKASRVTRDLDGATGKAGASVISMSGTTATAGGRMSRALDSTKSAAAGMSSGIGLAAAAGAAAVVAMGRDSIRAASALQEQMAATKTLFGAAADEMIAFGESADSLGLSTRAALEAGNAFGDLFSKIGFTSDATQTFSEDLVRMAADFASFKDMDPGDVLVKLKAGLAGETEPLRQIGVFLTAAKVDAEAMRMGLVDAHGEIDEGGKVAARYSLIMAEMGDAYGDVGRTADSYANTQRRASAEFENLKATIGEGLLPIMADLANIAGDVADELGGASESANDGSWVDSVPILNTLALALDKLAGGSEGAAEASDYLKDSQDKLADGQSRVKQNVELSTKALEEQRKAFDELLQATMAQFSSEVAYQRGVLGLTGDLEAYNEALAANRDGKADNDVAAGELTKQELGLRDALLGTAEAAVRQANDQAAAAGKTLSESQKYDVFRQALLKLKEQFPQLAGQIDGYVARLEKVPEHVRTDASLTGVELAKARAGDLRSALQAIPSFKNVTVRYDEVLGTTVQRGRFAGRTVERAAAGGYISGPGTGTSDSIPALLSNGEYVLRADAVKRLGVPALDRLNQKAMAGASSTLAHFASGGAVGTTGTTGRRMNDPGWLVATTAGQTTAATVAAMIGTWT